MRTARMVSKDPSTHERTPVPGSDDWAQINAIELLDDVFDFMRDELRRVIERSDLDGGLNSAICRLDDVGARSRGAGAVRVETPQLYREAAGVRDTRALSPEHRRAMEHRLDGLAEGLGKTQVGWKRGA
jgi:hypothetical protein